MCCRGSSESAAANVEVEQCTYDAFSLTCLACVSSDGREKLLIGLVGNHNSLFLSVTVCDAIYDTLAGTRAPPSTSRGTGTAEHCVYGWRVGLMLMRQCGEG